MQKSLLTQNTDNHPPTVTQTFHTPAPNTVPEPSLQMPNLDSQQTNHPPCHCLLQAVEGS